MIFEYSKSIHRCTNLFKDNIIVLFPRGVNTAKKTHLQIIRALNKDKPYDGYNPFQQKVTLEYIKKSDQFENQMDLLFWNEYWKMWFVYGEKCFFTQLAMRYTYHSYNSSEYIPKVFRQWFWRYDFLPASTAKNMKWAEELMQIPESMFFEMKVQVDVSLAFKDDQWVAAGPEKIREMIKQSVNPFTKEGFHPDPVTNGFLEDLDRDLEEDDYESNRIN